MTDITSPELREKLNGLADLLSDWFGQELSEQAPKLICSNGRHWTSLPNIEVGSKCICGGTWEINPE